MQILFSFLIACISPLTYATVYECVNTDGTSEYRDNPCTTQQVLQKHVALPKEGNTQKLQKKKALKKEEQLKQKHDKKMAKMRQSEAKQNSTHHLRKKRDEERCRSATEKLKKIEDILRHGYRLKKERTLKQKLEEQRELQRKYCTE